jgi:hypothetical protein
MERFGLWPLRGFWVAIPVTLGPSLDVALAPTSRPVQLTASIGLWALWTIALAAMLIPRAATLTVVRVVVPAGLMAAIWSVSTAGIDLLGVIGVGVALCAAVLALTGIVADELVNGSSYGDERRMTLRVPGPLMLGPVEATWVAIVAGAVTGPMLLAAEVWVVGVPATVVGAAAVALGVRAIHGLSTRWVIFVPTGLVLHDPASLESPVLFPRMMITRLGPAPSDTAATDVTAGALGLALQVSLAEPQDVVTTSRRVASREVTSQVMFTPARPSAVLAEADRRRIRVADSDVV